MLKIYTLPTCGICKMFKKKLAEKQIPYEEYNLTDYAEELHTDRAPVFVIDDTILYTPSEINKWIIGE